MATLALSTVVLVAVIMAGTVSMAPLTDNWTGRIPDGRDRDSFEIVGGVVIPPTPDAGDPQGPGNGPEESRRMAGGPDLVVDPDGFSADVPDLDNGAGAGNVFQPLPGMEPGPTPERPDPPPPPATEPPEVPTAQPEPPTEPVVIPTETPTEPVDEPTQPDRPAAGAPLPRPDDGPIVVPGRPNHDQAKPATWPLKQARAAAKIAKAQAKAAAKKAKAAARTKAAKQRGRAAPGKKKAQLPIVVVRPPARDKPTGPKWRPRKPARQTHPRDDDKWTRAQPHPRQKNGASAPPRKQQEPAVRRSPARPPAVKSSVPKASRPDSRGKRGKAQAAKAKHAGKSKGKSTSRSVRAGKRRGAGR